MWSHRRDGLWKGVVQVDLDPSEFTMTNDYLTIASEVRELENLLATIPEGNVVERMSLESRLESVKAALATLPQ